MKEAVAWCLIPIPVDYMFPSQVDIHDQEEKNILDSIYLTHKWTQPKEFDKIRDRQGLP